jgi:hypothetical protein
MVDAKTRFGVKDRTLAAIARIMVNEAREQCISKTKYYSEDKEAAKRSNSTGIEKKLSRRNRKTELLL